MQSKFFKENFKTMFLRAIFLSIIFYSISEYLLAFIKNQTILFLLALAFVLYKIDFKILYKKAEKFSMKNLFEVLLASLIFFFLIDFPFKILIILLNLLALYFAYKEITEKEDKEEEKVELKKIYEVQKVEQAQSLALFYDKNLVKEESLTLPIILSEDLPKSEFLYKGNKSLENLSSFIKDLSSSYVFGISCPNDREGEVFEASLKSEDKIIISFNPFLYSGENAMFLGIMNEFLKESGYFAEHPLDTKFLASFDENKRENFLEESLEKIFLKDGFKERLDKFLAKNEESYILLFNDIDALDVKEILSVFRISKILGELKKGIFIFLYDKEKIYKIFKNERRNLGIFYKFINQELSLPKLNYEDFYEKILRNLCSIYEKAYKKDEIISQENAIFNVDKLLQALLLLKVDFKDFIKIINLVFGTYLYEIMENIKYDRIKYAINLNDFLLLSFIKFSSYNLYSFIYEKKAFLKKESQLKKIEKKHPEAYKLLKLLSFPFDKEFSLRINNIHSFERYFDIENLKLYSDITFTLMEEENLKFLFDRNYKNPNFEEYLQDFALASKTNIFLFEELYRNYSFYKSINYNEKMSARVLKIESAKFLAGFLAKFSQADKRKIFKKYERDFFQGKDLEFKKYLLFYSLYSFGFRISKKEEKDFEQLLRNLSKEDYQYLSKIAQEKNFLKGILNKKLIAKHLQIILEENKEFNVNYDGEFLNFFSQALNFLPYREFQNLAFNLPLNSLNFGKASLVSLQEKKQDFMEKILDKKKEEILKKNINLYKDENFSHKNIFFLDFKKEEEKNYLHNLIKNLNKEELIWLLDDIKDNEVLFSEDKEEIQKRSLALKDKDEGYLKFKEDYNKLYKEGILTEKKLN